MAETPHLKIGDYIHLKYVKLNGYLTAEGVLQDELYCDAKPGDFDEVLFQVQLQRQYSAAYELNLFNQRQGDVSITEKLMRKGGEAEDRRTAQFRKALIKGRDNEINMNESFMNERLGTPVVFGDVIQLLHVKSQKYVSLMTGELARDERENMTAYLSPEGSADSWLQMLPRYKIDREGDNVPAITECYLKMAERANEYLHCADKEAPKGFKREVNIALGMPTSWRLEIFRSSKDVASGTNVMCGMSVVLLDPESNTYLSVCTAPVRLKTVTEVDLESAMSGELDYLDDVSVASAGDMEEFIEEYGDVVLINQPRGKKLNSTAIWVVESRELAQGGVIAWKTDMIRLRHFQTGKYLAMHPDKKHSFHSTSDGSSPETLLSVTNISNNTHHLLQKNCALLLHKGHHYVQRGNLKADLDFYTTKSTTHTSVSVNLILNEYCETEDGSNLRMNGLLQPLDLLAARTIKRFLQSYLDKTSVPYQGLFRPGSDNVWPRSDVLNFAAYEHGMQSVVHYISGEPLTILGTDGRDPDDEEEATNVADKLREQQLHVIRQDLLREQGILDIVLQMLNLLVPASLAAEKVFEQNVAVNTAAYSTVRKVVSTFLSLTLHLVDKNPANQIAVADHLLIVLGHVALDRKAATIVQSMLADNDEIQETKIGAEEIDIFAQRMHDREMNVVYMKMLTSCCSCNGSPVVSNQQVVENIIFGVNSSLLISMQVDEENMVDTLFGDKESIYVKALTNNAGFGPAHVLGRNLFERGCPVVKLTWSSFAEDSIYMAKTLYGVEPVPANMVMRQKAVVQSRSPDAVNARAHVIEFLRAQLLLSAEMCLGRNYPVMEAMEKDYPFQTLMSLYLLGQDDETKRFVLTLILRLYVDRDPQRVSYLPRLTRTVKYVGADRKLGVTEPRLPCVEDDRLSNFSLLQYIIKEEFAKMKGDHFKSHAASLAHLMHKLILFNFYGNQERMTDVIATIVDTLDRRGLDVRVVCEKQLSRRMTRRQSLSTSKSSKHLLRDRSSNNMDGADGDEEEEEKPDTWQSRTLAWLESTSMTIFMLFLVLISLAVAGYQIAALREPEYNVDDFDDAANQHDDVVSDPDANLRDYLFWIDVGIFIMFAVEFTTRFGCYWNVRGEIGSFWEDPFNWLDFVVILIDALLLGLGSLLAEAKDAGSFSKGLRMLRIAKVVRMFRLMKQMVNKGVRIWSKWKSPPRFVASPADDLNTMNELAHSLRATQRVVDDRNLSIMLSAFHEWMEEDEDESRSGTPFSFGRGLKGTVQGNGYKDKSPVEIFLEMRDHFDGLAVSSVALDDIFLDLIMYNDHELVQSTMDVLMHHHQAHSQLLNNFKNVQLLSLSKHELQFQRISRTLNEVNGAVDAFPLWGHLLMPEHMETLTKLMANLNLLTDMCRTRREVLVIAEEFEPDELMQDMLRNCGTFPALMRLLHLVDNLDRAGFEPEAVRKNKEMLKVASELLYWFSLSNEANQAMCFDDLEFFVEAIDAKIDSHVMLEATFKDNSGLMKACPKFLIGDLVKKISENGRFPEYLVLLSNVTCAGEKNILEKQFEVILGLAAPESAKRVLQYFCPVTHPDYQKKSKLMVPLVNRRELREKDLPRDLAYHLELVKVVTGCTVGRINITSVEAKVQSLWNFVDVVNAILDNNSPLLIRTRLAYFFHHAMVDVEMKIPSLYYAQCVWDLLATFNEVFAASKDMLRQIEKNGWAAPTSHRQLIEYMVVGVVITAGYFEIYFDRSLFKLDAGASATERSGGEKVKMRESQGDELIRTLFGRISDLFDLQSPLLCSEHKNYMYRALCALNKAAKVPIVALVENVELENEAAMEEIRAADGAKSRNIVSKKFEEFTAAIEESEEVQEVLAAEADAFIDKIEGVPLSSDPADSDVRYEPLMHKLVMHMSHSLSTQEVDGNLLRVMDDRCTATSTWVIRMFRSMIERKWGMTIDERDDDGGEEQDIAASGVMETLNNCGATVLCLDFIAPGIDRDLQVEAVKLLVALLFMEGGALPVQETIFAHLDKGGTDYFFRQMREMITELIDFHKWEGVIELEEDDDPELPEEIILIRFLQLMCEGHYGPNQDIMREQPNNHDSFNLLDDFVLYFHSLDSIACRTSTAAALAVSATILEVIQGPCELNQDHFALNTELIETLNRKMRSRARGDCDEEEELELKKTCVDIFQGLLEGQGSKVAVYERVLSVIHIDIVELLASPPPMVKRGKRMVLPEMSEMEVELQTESLVLIKMLLAFQPTLANELTTKAAKSNDTGGSSACVEIVWRGELQRRFFHVPDICECISDSTKATFVELVPRDSQESKLLGLLGVVGQVYREVKHQEYLSESGWAGVANANVIDVLAWQAFLVALMMNALMLLFYTSTPYTGTDVGNDDYPKYRPLRPSFIDPSVQATVTILIYVYMAIIVIVVVLLVFVRAPVRLQTFIDDGYSRTSAIVATALDPKILYFLIFLALAVMGLLFTPGFLTFLLLDIINKNSTCQSVLKSVTYPWKQLVIAAVMMFTIQYTVAFFTFRYFSTADHLFDPAFCETVWDCFKEHLFIGIGGDLGESLSSLNLGNRFMLNFIYFILQFVMLNIVGGIMIDTFSELRTNTINRVAETENFCFVCGIENITFDRSIGRGAFKHHIHSCHHMWDYLKFIIYIWEQDKDDDDGLEQYVRRCIEANDISWFPINKSLDLVVEEESSEADVLKSQWEAELKIFEKVSHKIAVSLQMDFLSKAVLVQEMLNKRRIETSALSRATTPAASIVRTGSVGAALNADLDEVNEVRVQVLCVHDVLKGPRPGGVALNASHYHLHILSNMSEPSDVPGFEAPQSSSTKDTSGIYFPVTPITVHEGMHIEKHDGMFCRVQLVQDMGFKGLGKVVGVVDIPLMELIQQHGGVYEKDLYLTTEQRTVKCTFYTATSHSILQLLELE